MNAYIITSQYKIANDSNGNVACEVFLEIKEDDNSNWTELTNANSHLLESGVIKLLALDLLKNGS